MKNALPIALAIATLLALAPLQFAAAQDCNPRSSSGVASATLADPRAPCRPAARERSQPQAAPSRGERGTFRHGNTTIHIGGSIQGETTIRGR
jgi:hypothetical protein